MKKKILSLLTVFGIYTLLLILLFFPLVFQSSTLVAPDSLIPHASTLALDKLQGETGSYPLWQPWLFSGMPTVEAFSYISGLYFPNMVFNLFHTDGIVLQLLHLAFAGLGVYLFLRQYGLTTPAAPFGGALFMLNPYMTAMLVHGHGSQLMTAAYMPWMLWAVMRLMKRGGLADAGVLALIAGFQLQRSHVQIAWYSWMLALLLAAVLLVFCRDSLQRESSHNGFPYGRILLLIAALVCGVTMSASIYLPASEYAPYSVRGMAAAGGASSWEYATLWSMHPLELLTFLAPGFFGFGGVTYWGFMPFTDFPNYAGIVVLLLAVAGAYRRRKEPMIWFFSAGALLALLLSFGRFFSPVFDLFYHFAPLFSRFRVPSMALIMLYLIIASLAAIGVNDLLQRSTERLLKPIRIGALFMAVFLLLLLAFQSPIESFFRSLFPDPSVESFDLSFMINKVRWEHLKGSLLIALFTLLLFTGVLWLGIKGKLSHKMTGLLFFLLALLDLLWIDIQIIYPSDSSLRSPVFAESRMVAQAFQPDDITRYLAAQKGEFRIYPAGPLFTENKFALSGIESVGGYHPAKLKIYEEFLAKTENLSSINVLRMLNVGYIVTPVTLSHPALEPVKTGTLQLAGGPVPVTIYRLQATLPRVRFAERVTGVRDSDELFLRLLDDAAPQGEAFVDGSLWSGTRTFAAATVLSMQRGSESMRLKVSVPGDAFLVVSEIYYPLRWKVTVDGKPAEMVRVNGLLRGVKVPAGSREVLFYYDRSLFETARRISFAAFFVALLMVAGGVFIGRLRQKGGETPI
ncbi:hypothetical protein G9409_02475 [Chlorobium sp. BLA1]|uniref:hypothetical protein n=1 Tax=Candidatus Chlorobium masyuteum TaxID=2716876 RepID=UPI001420DE73|nr:hypothetical protein [Candidatus Chlorobium masyuteum]NHQ59466.1 hypothetical protein [Candidatus Chlorobium masyuteum]